MSQRDERTPEQKLEDSHLYGLCSTCGYPRKLIRRREGAALLCPGCVTDENGQGDGPAPVPNWRDLRREIVDLICDGMASRDGRPSHHVEASDLLAEYVTALDIAKGDASAVAPQVGASARPDDSGDAGQRPPPYTVKGVSKKCLTTA